MSVDRIVSSRWAVMGLLLIAIGGLRSLPALDWGVAEEHYFAGRWQEALDGYRHLLRQPDGENARAIEALGRAVVCMARLNRWADFDDMMEALLAKPAEEWRLGMAVVDLLGNGRVEAYDARRRRRQYTVPSQATMIDGVVQRGRHGGEPYNLRRRDRVRALARGTELLPVILGEKEDRAAAGQALLTLADLWRHPPQGDWALQSLTDLTTVPEAEPGYAYHGRTDGGAAVAADGTVVVYAVPEQFEAAANDGERWVWLLAAAERRDQKEAARLRRANAAEAWFGVATLAGTPMPFAREEGRELTDAAWMVDTLSDDETIARLATGIRRFPLPEGWNHLAIYREIGAWDRLATIYEHRRQYPAAAEAWRQTDNQKRLAAVIDPWLRLDAVAPQAAGDAPALPLLFRNAGSAQVTVERVRLAALIDHVSERMVATGEIYQWQNQVLSLDQRLLEHGQERWLGAPVAQWEEALDPAPEHRDRRHALRIPVTEAGAYLVTVRADGGNVSRAILWLVDTVLVHIPQEGDQSGQQLFFLADARSGEPVAGATVAGLGVWSERNEDGTTQVRHERFTVESDADGLAQLSTPVSTQARWLITAGDGRRLAVHETGFPDSSHRWRHLQTRTLGLRDPQAYALTDRPLYRPGQRVSGRVWAARASYAETAERHLVGWRMRLRIFDPRGETVYETALRTDDQGGALFEWAIPEESTLGRYRVAIDGAADGSVAFRVEEYRPPEFAVTIEAPEDPVTLGEPVIATVAADYLWGQPVAGAEISYTITRQAHQGLWFPPHPWDWLYGAGYWWRGQERYWLPGPPACGIPVPPPIWCPQPSPPPETVARGTAQLDAEGRFALPIDTAIAKALYGEEDQRYTITAEITDSSRRTEVGRGQVVAAARPFRVLVWADRGHLRSGGHVTAQVAARRADGRGVDGSVHLELRHLRYDDQRQPIETVLETWQWEQPSEGQGEQRLTLPRPGQYRLVATVRRADGTSAEGSHLLTVTGAEEPGSYRFSALEVVPDRETYRPGDQVELLIGADAPEATVLLFERPLEGLYRGRPRVLHLRDGAALHRLTVARSDQPNCFVEAIAVHGAEVHRVIQRIVVPPEKRTLEVAVEAEPSRLEPGDSGRLRIRVSDAGGRPVTATAAVTIYDRSLDLLAGDLLPPPIHEFFWKWTWWHRPGGSDSLPPSRGDLRRRGEPGMRPLGMFGHLHELGEEKRFGRRRDHGPGFGGSGRELMMEGRVAAVRAAPMAARAEVETSADTVAETGGEPAFTPAVRSAFARRVLWSGAVMLDADGRAELPFTMPDTVTGWVARVVTLGPQAAAGQGETDLVTAKDLLVRLHLPRFATEGDRFVVSATVHNSHAEPASGRIRLSIEEGGEALELGGAEAQTFTLPAGGEQRFDWSVTARAQGRVRLRATAVVQVDGADDGDAVEMDLPLHIYGAETTQSRQIALRSGQHQAQMRVTVPEERIPEATRLTVRWSPTVAGAVIEAIPYLVDFPYGSTDQTLHRFLPAVVAQDLLLRFDLDLAAIRDRRSQLNPGQLGTVAERSEQWRQWAANPVFDRQAVRSAVVQGLQRLARMQNGDGGWGWFSGPGERSWPHTTAQVVRGLLVARRHDAAVPEGMLERGLAWLRRHHDEQRALLDAGQLPDDDRPRRYRRHASHLDALVHLVLVESGHHDAGMHAHLLRDRLDLSLHAQSLLGLACHLVDDVAGRDLCLGTLRQFVEQSDELDTAWLRLASPWWYWYGGVNETHAAYLSLLVASRSDDELAGRLARHLIGGRRGNRWNSTRDTAWAVEALAAFVVMSGELDPDLVVRVSVDGRLLREQRMTRETLFTHDTTLVLEAEDLPAGERVIDLETSGRGPLYANAWLSVFSRQDPIPAQGLAVQVQRSVWRLEAEDVDDERRGGHGQVVAGRHQRYRRERLESGATIASGDLLEVELIIDSGNDYEYIMVEDHRFAGGEPVEQRSGHHGGAYIEYRTDRVALFLRDLPRGQRTLRYRLRAETPGVFSAMPAVIRGVYAPELIGNSASWRVEVEDAGEE